MWTEGSRIVFPANGPCAVRPVVFANEVYAPDPQFPANQWVTVNCALTDDGEPTGLPSDVLAVHLAGILILTNPGQTKDETADLRVWLRKTGVGSAYGRDYIGQVCEVQPGGVRSGFSALCAVDALKFDIWWERNTPLPYPAHQSFGVKLYVDWAVRP